MKYPSIKYTKGWDYVLSETVTVSTGIFPTKTINHKDEFILTTDGKLTVYKGYPWDGATGAMDTKNSMVASLVHDCFCEMTRVGELNYDAYAPYMHDLLGDIAEDHGMFGWRAAAWRKVTAWFRGGHPSHPDPHPILTAP